MKCKHNGTTTPNFTAAARRFGLPPISPAPLGLPPPPPLPPPRSRTAVAGTDCGYGHRERKRNPVPGATFGRYEYKGKLPSVSSGFLWAYRTQRNLRGTGIEFVPNHTGMFGRVFAVPNPTEDFGRAFTDKNTPGALWYGLKYPTEHTHPWVRSWSTWGRGRARGRTS